MISVTFGDAAAVGDGDAAGLPAGAAGDGGAGDEAENRDRGREEQDSGQEQ